jgi:hypothetical protein
MCTLPQRPRADRSGALGRTRKPPSSGSRLAGSYRRSIRGFRHVVRTRCALVELSRAALPDWLVVDSYTIPSEQISRCQIRSFLCSQSSTGMRVAHRCNLPRQNLGAKRHQTNRGLRPRRCLARISRSSETRYFAMNDREGPWKCLLVLCFLSRQKDWNRSVGRGGIDRQSRTRLC